MSLENLAGQTLGQYELKELLGAGGMGAVYRAYQKNLKRWVAIKILPSTLAGQTLYLERFNREAETAASLEHQHIVPVYDYGVQRGTSYVVMRLLNGGSLAERLNDRLVNEKPLPAAREVAQLLKQVGSALDYAHAQGVIHRDVKPSNIMFDNQGVPFLVDFGIAKLMEATSGLTGTNTTMGTPSYMPPEQWRGEKVNPASDQYSLAVIAYQLLVGKLPFEATTPYALMHKHLNEVPHPPHLERSGIPEMLTLVLERALAKQPEDRFTDCSTFSQAFESACVEFEDIKTNFFTMPLPTRAKVSTKTVRNQPETEIGTTVLPTPKPIYQQPITWGIGAVVILLLAGLIFFLLSQGDDDNGGRGSGNNDNTRIAQDETPGDNGNIPPGDVTPSATATDDIFDPELAIEATINAEATRVAAEATGTARQQTIDAGVIARGQTATATLWTKTPTPTSSQTSTPTRTRTPSPSATDTPTATLTPSSTHTPTQTLTPSTTFTSSPSFTPSQTFTASPTFTASNTLAASNTPSPTRTPTPTASRTAPPTVDTRATIEAMSGTTPTVVANHNPQLVENVPGTLAFGPQDGSFTYRDDGFIRSVPSGVNTRDFIAEITFVNPYPTSEGVWDAGFLFREIETNEQLRLTIDSESNYTLNNWEGEGQVVELRTGQVTGLNLEDGDTNQLMLVVVDGTGMLFINGEFMTTLNLVSRMDAGNVSFGSALFEDHMVEAEIMRYRDFAVWAIDENACLLTPNQNQVRLRKGPSTTEAVSGNVSPGEDLLVTGFDTPPGDTFTWWQIAGNLWIREDVATTSGDCTNIPQVSSVIPTPTPTLTLAPSLTPTPKAVLGSSPTPFVVADISTLPIGIAPVFGPSAGTLQGLDNDLIDYVPSRISIKDFIAEATIQNPTGTNQAWDFALLIRDQGPEFYAVVIESDGSWELMLILETGTTSVASGTHSNFDTSEGGSNHIRVIGFGNFGLLYLNDEFLGTLDLSSLPDAGDVSIASGLDTPFDVDRQFAYEDFTVWSMEEMITDLEGSLAHDADGNLETVFTRASAQDFVVTATFSNPYDVSSGAWDYGLLFRNSPAETFILNLNSSKQWTLFLLQGGQYNTLATGTIPNLLTGDNEQNDVVLFAVGEQGYLFINGEFNAALDLSQLITSGGLALNIGIVNEVAGETTSFNGVNIWRLE